MTLTPDLLRELLRLKRTEKLRVVQVLINDLATEEDAQRSFETDYEVWSPFDAPDAAATLLTMLEKDMDG